MAKIKALPLAVLLTILPASCLLFPDFGFKPPDENFDILEENSFYAQDMTNEEYYKVKAEKLYEGAQCVIWAEKGSGVTLEQARTIASEYDGKIRRKIIDAFSEKNFTFTYQNEEYYFNDTLDFANWLVDGSDGKLTILLLDIQDGYKNPRTDSYVAGYFFSGNFYSQGKIAGTEHYSNGRDMIYVDTDPGLRTETRQTYATFAHELQHLINFVTTVRLGRTNLMDTWVDEGLSSQAEYFYLEENPQEKCEWFSADPKGTIAEGNNFFVWGNHGNEPLAILDDYATVYLYFRWLYLQADTGLQSNIFYDIITSSYFDYRAVTAAAGNINPSWHNWENLLRTWFAANYYPENPYGYTGDRELQDIVKINPIKRYTISLFPGEGVYSIIDGSYSFTNVRNIRYAGLGNTGVINIASPYTEDVLLTFNTNTNKSAWPEGGSLTGVPVSPDSQTARDNARSIERTRPYVIDAQDILGRKQDIPIRLPR